MAVVELAPPSKLPPSEAACADRSRWRALLRAPLPSLPRNRAGRPYTDVCVVVFANLGRHRRASYRRRESPPGRSSSAASSTSTSSTSTPRESTRDRPNRHHRPGPPRLWPPLFLSPPSSSPLISATPASSRAPTRQGEHRPVLTSLALPISLSLRPYLVAGGVRCVGSVSSRASTATARARPGPRPDRPRGRGLSGPCPAIWAGPVAGASRVVART